MLNVFLKPAALRSLWRRVGIIAVACIMIWTAAGCVAAPTSIQRVAPSPTSLSKLVVCTSVVDAANMNVQFARSEHIFEHYGLDVNLTATSSGPEAVAALLAGDFAICQIAGAAVVNAVAAGGDLVIVGGVVNRQPYYLVTRADIKTPAGLKGQSVGVSGPGSNTDIAARAALKYLGLQSDQDVAVLSIGGPSERLAALSNGAVAGTILSPPGAMVAMAAGSNLLLDFAEIDKPYQHVAIVTTRQFLSKHPELVKAFLQASAEAVGKMQADKPRTLAIMADYLQLDPVKHAQALALTYDLLIQKQMNVESLPSLPGIQALIDELVKDNPRVANLKPEGMVDLASLTELTAAGFFKSLQESNK